jgi:hypothetical protein
MSAPVGNQNARKRNRMLTDALKRELTQKPEEVLAIALKLIEDAKNGDNAARAMLFDRVDGKVPQPLVGGDDDESPIKTLNELLIRGIDAASNRPTEEGAGHAASLGPV